jgi:uncharacterized membrane protein
LLGFIQRIDFPALESISRNCGKNIALEIRVGDFVFPGMVLAYIVADTSTSDTCDDVISCFLIGKVRTFDDDPRYGLIVLSEIASRALSPAINDPGTAIHVVCALARLLVAAKTVSTKTGVENRFPNIQTRKISAEELFDAAFRAIARDGAEILEVGVFLQKVPPWSFESARIPGTGTFSVSRRPRAKSRVHDESPGFATRRKSCSDDRLKRITSL